MRSSSEVERIRAAQLSRAAELRAEAADLMRQASALNGRAALIERTWQTSRRKCPDCSPCDFSCHKPAGT